MTSSQLIEQFGKPVDLEMQRWFKDHESTIPAYLMSEYHLGWRNESLNATQTLQGKMLRPILCLLSYEVFRNDFERAIPLAAAIEFYHNHTLVFDDMQDGDKLRRGRPTVWSLWGIGQGINVGLLLGYVAQQFLFFLYEKGFSHEKLGLLNQAAVEAFIEVAEGQSLDLHFETTLDVSPELYLEMIGKKTGALISLCCYGGTLLAQDDLLLSEKFKAFGRQLGVAMQIKDDLVGIWGGSQQSGKEIAKDLWRRKKTFPIFKARQLLKKSKLDSILSYFESEKEPDRKTVESLVDLLEKEGVREVCEQEASELMSQVFVMLRDTQIPAAKLASLESFSRHAFDSIGTLRQASYS